MLAEYAEMLAQESRVVVETGYDTITWKEVRRGEGFEAVDVAVGIVVAPVLITALVLVLLI